MANLSAKEKAKLGKVVEATKSATGFIVSTAADMKTLVDAGFVAANPSDATQFKATDAGLTAMGVPAGSTAPPPVKTPSPFKIVKGIALPPSKRRVGETAGSQYPFDDLEIPEGAEWGDSFHVAKTEKMPDPAKSLASSVTAANMRFSKPEAGQHKTRKGTMKDNYQFTRMFQIREVGADDPEGPGARIWRTKVVPRVWTTAT